MSHNFFILYSIEICRSYVYLFVCWCPSLELSFICVPVPLRKTTTRSFSAIMCSMFVWLSGNAVRNSLKNCLNHSLPSPAKYFSISDRSWLLKTSSINDFTRALFFDKDILLYSTRFVCHIMLSSS
jgi:hypothetical protein